VVVGVRGELHGLDVAEAVVGGARGARDAVGGSEDVGLTGDTVEGVVGEGRGHRVAVAGGGAGLVGQAGDGLGDVAGGVVGACGVRLLVVEAPGLPRGGAAAGRIVGVARRDRGKDGGGRQRG